ncbi:MAG: hypothetical protein KC582_02810 [Candidatus Magasanikbacteria bacterium]|nr:hypothetical protein [Candidatus Magasanikbacteria bacterium]
MPQPTALDRALHHVGRFIAKLFVLILFLGIYRLADILELSSYGQLEFTVGCGCVALFLSRILLIFRAKGLGHDDMRTVITRALSDDKNSILVRDIFLVFTGLFFIVISFIDF